MSLGQEQQLPRARGPCLVSRVTVPSCPCFIAVGLRAWPGTARCRAAGVRAASLPSSGLPSGSQPGLGTSMPGPQECPADYARLPMIIFIHLE